MSARAREASSPPAPFQPALPRSEAADAARRRLIDPAYRVDPDRRRGRGAVANPTGRYEPAQRETFEDGWAVEEELAPLDTEVIIEKPRTIIARNDSPDIGFDRSINPYRGCEHGCSYCFARPSHAFHGLSSGLDFETKIFAKPSAPDLLEKELRAKGYEPKTIAMGSNTDPYQPLERRFRITRAILETLNRTNHPVGIVTKSALVTRDIDILSQMADRQLAKVAISITTLDPRLARKMEPRAASPAKRLETVRKLAEAGIPVTVLVAPIIPAINDHEIEAILKASYAAGAREAGYVLLRLPHDLKDLMRDWLAEHYPDKLNHVFSLLQEARGGKDYDSGWGVRQTGVGPFAWMLGRRFETATARLGMNTRRIKLRTDLFVPPAQDKAQLSLF
ncbi:PA0069 family radical SAM protein [Microvirga brassicacearum]|uniref:PA0069 family radical SAM protein n=1 Tax=Microvirga brassicacearum TaxID=2580413 RepID=A0A5N3P457_9HYPH|nr:PA0069 family radical SAM protein [Microvirga brassicacearum]KAB0264492.1 PA0069 family radical SAM protein [Microvirga brassicacearum]